MLAPSKAVAPPLPFTLVGQQMQDGIQQVFLSHEGKTYVVKAGDKIEDVYLVEAVEAHQMTLIYLPLNELQTLNLD